MLEVDDIQSHRSDDAQDRIACRYSGALPPFNLEEEKQFLDWARHSYSKRRGFAAA